MGIAYSPSPQDVERYRSLRALSKALNSRMLEIVPSHAMLETGEAIGILRGDVLIFETQDLTSVHMDCCLYDWYEDGENLLQRYARQHPAEPCTDESLLLGACLRAKFAVLVVQSVAPGAGVYCRDILNGMDLFVMDMGLGDTARPGAAFATRVIPLGEYWMTGGAGLPIPDLDTVLDEVDRLRKRGNKAFDGPGGMARMLVRACLAAGAAKYIRYQDAPPPPAKAKKKRRR